MDLQSVVGRLLAQVSQIIVVKLLEGVQVGDEERIGLERRGVVNELAGFPAQGADREIVEAKFDTWFSNCGRGSGVNRCTGQNGQSCRSRNRGLKEGASSGLRAGWVHSSVVE